MIRAGCLVLMLAAPAAAEDRTLCATVWAKVAEGLSQIAPVSMEQVTQEGDWCVVEAPVLDLPGQYLPDWHMDRLRFRGAALGWIAYGSTLPEGLEVGVEGLRLVVQTGNPQMDWLIAAQSKPNAIDAEVSLSWDAGAKVLKLEGLTVDFPGENAVQASALVRGVDLSSTGGMQMSVTSFALAETDLRITMHGLFEWYVLMTIGPSVLPYEGDIDAAAEDLRVQMREAVAGLPEGSVSQASKAALWALIDELPNPSGDLTVAVRSEAGIGPARLGGYAMTGVPQSVDEAAPLLQGVTVDVGWTPADAP
jgi:hypothetical protein